jgi:hypothetical protein
MLSIAKLVPMKKSSVISMTPTSKSSQALMEKTSPTKELFVLSPESLIVPLPENPSRIIFA